MWVHRWTRTVLSKYLGADNSFELFQTSMCTAEKSLLLIAKLNFNILKPKKSRKCSIQSWETLTQWWCFSHSHTIRSNLNLKRLSCFIILIHLFIDYAFFWAFPAFLNIVIICSYIYLYTELQTQWYGLGYGHAQKAREKIHTSMGSTH